MLARVRSARAAFASAKHALVTQQAKFAQERSEQSATLAARKQQAVKFIKAGEIARMRLARNPELGFGGLSHVLQLAARPQAPPSVLLMTRTVNLAAETMLCSMTSGASLTKPIRERRGKRALDFDEPSWRRSIG
ncbi:hypothetical protein X566_10675 [Afipia sp. P52-10]|nr:hypothetical protein X566_10675 [Afipia sp. P52-10]